MLSFKNRFHGHSSLRYVYKNGQAERTHLITLKHIVNPHRKHSRVAIVISKKVLKSAVRRNRVRRRLYEIVRHRLEQVDPSLDMVFLVFSAEVLAMPQVDLEELVDQLLEATGNYKKSA